jgi:hypothetical protein
MIIRRTQDSGAKVLKKRNIYLCNVWKNRNTSEDIFIFNILKCVTSKADTILLFREIPKLNKQNADQKVAGTSGGHCNVFRYMM